MPIRSFFHSCPGKLRAACGLIGALTALGAGAQQPPPTAAAPPAGSGNRIEVTGNSARNVVVDCRGEPAVQANSVNSVNIDRRALHGQTVIVTGRNTQDVRVQSGCQGANVNSVNIR